TTIQKLGLALHPGNEEYAKSLQPLKNKRFAFIFDECHRSQFGENHKAIKEFFPNAQLFGFTGTPIFETNATYKKIDGTIGSYLTTKDVFQKLLHAYTITHAIDDKNVLPFHIDYYKPEENVKIGSAEHQNAVATTILKKHDAATNHRRFNALFATSSINDAIEYYQLFQKLQEEQKQKAPDYIPLNITCVFTPPAEGNKDILQLQEELDQEREDNKTEPEKKKQALAEIIRNYNKQYGTTILLSSHLLGEVEQICDRIVILHKGKIVASDAMSKLLHANSIIRLRVDDMGKSVKIIDKLKEQNFPIESVENTIEEIIVRVSDNCAKEINTQLVTNGIGVSHISFEPQSLEQYFMEITEGETDVT
ncbi:MAG: hypothetical protein D6707_10525, partial [Bacteroidetes bacterium]